MGSPISQVQMPQTNQPSGKGGPMTQVANQVNQAPVPDTQSDGISRPMGKGGRITHPGQSGQPQYGQPNRYSNTVGPWDNASIGTQNPFQRSGKGKGA